MPLGLTHFLILSTMSSFSLPLSFLSSHRLCIADCTNACTNSLMDGFLKGKPTEMKPWTRTIDGQDQSHEGLVVGCEDGTLYVFHNKLIASLPDVIEHVPEVHQPLPSKITAKHHLQTSRSTSPSTSSALLLVSPRARAVSGVSTEWVEAPKNYVDFDDEAGKLKDMLKGKNPSTKTLSDTASERAISIKSSTPPTVPPTEITLTARMELSKVLINFPPPNNSRHFSTPTSPREPMSPGMEMSDELGLRYHIIPRTNGPGNAVRSMFILTKSFICIVLQESG